jgi:circadian clock protein KaiB
MREKDTVQEVNTSDWQEDALLYQLRLYVAGTSPASVRAINNLQRILEVHLKDRYNLEIIDVYQQPLLAQSEQIIAVPVMIKTLPGPKRLLIGDMSDTNRVLRGIGLTN